CRVESARPPAVLIQPAEDVAHLALGGAERHQVHELQRRQAKRALEQLAVARELALEAAQQRALELVPYEQEGAETQHQHDCEVSRDDLQPHVGVSYRVGAEAIEFEPAEISVLRGDIIAASKGSSDRLVAWVR